MVLINNIPTEVGAGAGEIIRLRQELTSAHEAIKELREALKRREFDDDLDETSCSMGTQSCPECGIGAPHVLRGKTYSIPHEPGCYIGEALAKTEKYA